MSIENQKKVLVLMSGGVDSSVAAALLKKQGYEATGVYLKLWEERTAFRNQVTAAGATRNPVTFSGWGIGDPCWVKDKRDAEKVAAKIGIPFFVLDVTREYQKRVMDYFIKEYAAGRTPNPDVMCNSEIKFGFVLEKALSLGYDYVASGHYARLDHVTRNTKHVTRRSKLLHAKCYMLHKALDSNKDQSYFLWALKQKQLARILFPIGNYTKPQVRQVAKKFNLPVWDKKDSQGICFLGKVDLRQFLGRKIKAKKGPIVDIHNKKLGEHQGTQFFTIGQHVSVGGTGPYYVVDKNLKKNVLIVANAKEEKKYYKKEFTVNKLNWISGKAPDNFSMSARIRYRAPLKKANIYFDKYFHTSKYGSICRVVFKRPERAVTLGQSVVFYLKDKCLGGGIIRD